MVPQRDNIKLSLEGASWRAGELEIQVASSTR